MIKGYPRTMTKLINEFSKMPGIGPRSAQRLAFYILQSPKGEVDSLMKHIHEVKENVRFCNKCNNLSDKETCDICSDPSRDHTTICVVEGPNGVIAMEKIGAYDGIYHVLLGELSPIDGVVPEELKIKELISRVKEDNVKIQGVVAFGSEGAYHEALSGEVVEVTKHLLKVKAADQCLCFSFLQPPGKKVLSVTEFISGYLPKVGERFS